MDLRPQRIASSIGSGAPSGRGRGPWLARRSARRAPC